MSRKHVKKHFDRLHRNNHELVVDMEPYMIDCLRCSNANFGCFCVCVYIQTKEKSVLLIDIHFTAVVRPEN